MSQNPHVKFTSEVEPLASNNLPDPDVKANPDERRREQQAEAWHGYRLFLLRKILYVGTAFLFVLFFVIMPFSQMYLDAENALQWIQNYSRAFIAAFGSFGLTVVAVLVSELLKRAYNFLKNSEPPS